LISSAGYLSAVTRFPMDRDVWPFAGSTTCPLPGKTGGAIALAGNLLSLSDDPRRDYGLAAYVRPALGLFSIALPLDFHFATRAVRRILAPVDGGLVRCRHLLCCGLPDKIPGTCFLL